MNKYETAIAEITNRAEHTLKTVISADTAQLAIEALGKQIPKKIKKADIDFTIYGCPSCDFSDSLWSCGKYDKYCPNCGQKIDWSGDDEYDYNNA